VTVSCYRLWPGS